MPKTTASPEVWERYKARVLSIKARNDAKMKPYEEATAYIERTKTFVEGIKNPFLKKRTVKKNNSVKKINKKRRGRK